VIIILAITGLEPKIIKKTNLLISNFYHSIARVPEHRLNTFLPKEKKRKGYQVSSSGLKTETLTSR